MATYPPTLVLQHYKERQAKNTLRPLREREDLRFVRFPKHHVPGEALPGLPVVEVNARIVLALDGPTLSPADAERGLLMLDGTWRLAEKMWQAVQALPGVALTVRSLPTTWRTAYPRRQDDCPEPTRGLATVEALFIAYRLLGRPTAGLLDHYHWRDEFLSLNAQLIDGPSS